MQAMPLYRMMHSSLLLSRNDSEESKLLERMVERGLVQKGTVRYNRMQQIFTFHYSCGVAGGFILNSQVKKN